MKFWFIIVLLITLAWLLVGCFSSRSNKADDSSKVPPAAPPEADRPFLGFTDKKVNVNNITDNAGNTVWSLIKPSGSEIRLAGEKGLLFSRQTGPTYAGLRTSGNLTGDSYVFEVSFQVDRMGAVSSPMVLLIPRTKDFVQKQYYAVQYSLENGRLKWRLINTAAPASFNNENDPKREAFYVMKWGQTYTARIVINNVGENSVNLQFFLDDPDHPELGKKPLINYNDSTPHRIMSNNEVGPQVGTSGSVDVQPSVIFNDMRMLSMEEWNSQKGKPSGKPQASGLPIAALAAASGTNGRSENGSGKLALPTVFSDRMVLQQHRNIPVWGKGTDGERVSVSFAGQKAETTVQNGKWMVQLDPVQAGGPYEMVVQGKQDQIMLKEVLVGEVWILSGQSNMEWTMRSLADPEDISQANDPSMRLFTSRRNMYDEPQWDIPGGAWAAATPNTVSGFPAAGYYFGQELRKKYNVPIGLIATAVGSTEISIWMRGETFQDANYKANPANQQPGYLYNARIAPLQPFAIAGVVWWQGESNASNLDKDKNYSEKFASLIKDWRSQWKQGDFPFLYVQLSNYNHKYFHMIREEQLLTLSKTSNTGMAVTIDNGELNDIHPHNKKETGYRLSLIADALAYGKPVEYMGPIYKDMEIKDNRISIRFDHTGSGLQIKGDRLKGFKICGPDRVFVDAEARVEGDKVIVYSEKINNPIAVRYAYESFPEANLYNKEGLPASPFRTDRFE